MFGYFLSRLDGPGGETLRNFWVGVHDVMIMITMWIMRFAPIGVFALVGKTLIVSGFAALEALGLFFVTVLLALAVHFAVWLPLLLRLFAGVKPYAYYGKVVPAQLTAFSTASSSATLPVSMNAAEQAGVSKRVTGFVLPLGATVNMDGTALYECVVVIFIAQVYALVSRRRVRICRTVHRRAARPAHLHWRCRHTGGEPGRHRTDSAGGGPASGGAGNRPWPSIGSLTCAEPRSTLPAT